MLPGVGLSEGPRAATYGLDPRRGRSPFLAPVELVGETLRAAVNDLAVQAPDWVRAVARADWYDRYQRRSEQGRLPKGKEARESYAQTVGEDGLYLLEMLAAATTPAHLRELPSVKTLEVIWRQQY